MMVRNDTTIKSQLIIIAMGMMHTVIYPTMIYYSVENLVRISNLEDGLTN
jgi:hypothetical protein